MARSSLHGITSLVLDDQGDKVSECRHCQYGEEQWAARAEKQ